MIKKPTPSADTGRSDRIWRDDQTSVQFVPEGHRGYCVIHRLAFRTLLGFAPTQTDCLLYFDSQPDVFHKAAHEKIARRALPESGNFHLNSRDIRRILS